MVEHHLVITRRVSAIAANTEIYDLKYFWEEKGDIERYCHFEKLMTQIQEQVLNTYTEWKSEEENIKK